MTDTTDLRNKLARQTGREVAQNGAAEEPVAVVVRKMIERQASAFRTVLPATVDHDRFARLVMVAIKANPKLIRCFDTDLGQTSVLFAAMQAAALGLEPNTPLQHCWLQPRRRSVKNENNEWVKVDECELSIGYRGYIKLMMDTGKVKEVDAVAVHKGDDFGWSRGLGGNKLHYTAGEADNDGDEASLTHAYAVVRFKKKHGGGQQFVVLNRRQVHARREMSPSWQADQKYGKKESPWSNWPEEQWAKTALRALVKMVDLSREVVAAVSTDEARLALSDGQVTALPYQETAGELEQAPVSRDTLRSNAGLPVESGDYLEPPTDVDPATGEIETTATEPADPPPASSPNPPGEDTAAVGPMSKPQQGLLFKLLAEIGIEDRRERLTWASATLGREVATYNELIFAEASILIDVAKRQLGDETGNEPFDGGDAA